MTMIYREFKPIYLLQIAFHNMISVMISQIVTCLAIFYASEHGVLQQNYDKKHISDLLASVGAIINQSAYPLGNQVIVRQTGSSRSDDKPKEEFS
jgi:hypothetical protein